MEWHHQWLETQPLTLKGTRKQFQTREWRLRDNFERHQTWAWAIHQSMSGSVMYVFMQPYLCCFTAYDRIGWRWWEVQLAISGRPRLLNPYDFYWHHSGPPHGWTIIKYLHFKKQIEALRKMQEAEEFLSGLSLPQNTEQIDICIIHREINKDNSCSPIQPQFLLQDLQGFSTLFSGHLEVYVVSSPTVTG